MHFSCYMFMNEHMFTNFLSGDWEAAEWPYAVGNVFYGPYAIYVDGIALRRPPQLQKAFENGPREVQHPAILVHRTEHPADRGSRENSTPNPRPPSHIAADSIHDIVYITSVSLPLILSIDLFCR